MFRGGQPTKLPVTTRPCESGTINGSFCATQSYEQSLVYDFNVCLECSFCNHEDQNSNNIKQACWVQILSSTSSPAQKTWQWLSHLLQTVSFLAQWTCPLLFQRIPQPIAELEVWAKGQNVIKRGPLATKGEENKWSNSESGYGCLYWNPKSQENTTKDVKNNLLKTKIILISNMK